MRDHLIVILGFAWMTAGLMFIAYQTVILSRMLAQMQTEVAILLKLH